MNKIQKLIDEQVDAKAYATERCLYYHNLGLYKTAKDYNERARRIALYIQDLTLLLNTGNEKQR